MHIYFKQVQLYLSISDNHDLTIFQFFESPIENCDPGWWPARGKIMIVKESERAVT